MKFGSKEFGKLVASNLLREVIFNIIIYLKEFIK